MTPFESEHYMETQGSLLINQTNTDITNKSPVVPMDKLPDEKPVDIHAEVPENEMSPNLWKEMRMIKL